MILSMRIQLTQDEVMNRLKEQVSFLKGHCAQYDAWNELWAKKIAADIAILVHTKGSSISLLNQLGKSDIMFYDLCPEYDSNSIATTQWWVKILLSNQNSSYMPMLEDLPPSFLGRKLSFWARWERSIVIVDDLGNKFTRYNLIMEVRDTDWGSHSDEALNEDYYRLTTTNSTGRNQEIWWSKIPISNRSESATIRQIWQEVIKTISEEFSL